MKYISFEGRAYSARLIIGRVRTKPRVELLWRWSMKREPYVPNGAKRFDFWRLTVLFVV